MTGPGGDAKSAKRGQGKVVIPAHELIRRIAIGSYGEVWLARSVHREIRAIKLVFRDSFRESRPYEREYSGLVKFEPLSREHDGLMDILQVGRDDEAGFFYYVMEVADDANGPANQDPGEPPATNWDRYEPCTLSRCVGPRGRLPVEEVLKIIIPLAEGLAFLHEQRLIHRDIKPSNIILVRGQPKLADVGLVARMDDTISLVGTEGFIPPEGPGTAQGDVYALGKVMYEAATGKDRHEFPELPTRLDTGLPDADLLELNEAVLRACARRPEERYSNARELLADLRALQAGQSLRGQRRRKQRLRAVGLTGALVLGVVALIFGWWLFQKHRTVLVERKIEFPLEARVFTPPGDFEGDGEPDIFLCTPDGYLTVIGLDSQRLAAYRFFEGIPALFEIDRLADVAGNRADEIFVRWRDATTHHISVFNQLFHEIKRFDAPVIVAWTTNFETVGGKIVTNIEERSSAWRLQGVLPQEGTNEARALLTSTHGCRQFPRELICTNFSGSSQGWRIPIPAELRQLLLHDLDGDGVSDVVFGTGAPQNGVRLPDGRTDATGYLGAVKSDGQQMWCIPFAPFFCSVQLQMGWVDGAESIFASASRGMAVVFAGRNKQIRGYSRLARVNLDGKVLANWEGTNELFASCLAALPAGGPTNLFVPDSQGFLNCFAPADLSLIRRIPVTPSTRDWVHLEVIGIQDLNGDGRREIVLFSQQFQHDSGTNLGRVNGDRNRDFAYDNRVVILDDQFHPMASFLVEQVFKNNYCPILGIVENRALGCKEIAVLGDRALFLRLPR